MLVIAIIVYFAKPNRRRTSAAFLTVKINPPRLYKLFGSLCRLKKIPPKTNPRWYCLQAGYMVVRDPQAGASNRARDTTTFVACTTAYTGFHSFPARLFFLCHHLSPYTPHGVHYRGPRVISALIHFPSVVVVVANRTPLGFSPDLNCDFFISGLWVFYKLQSNRNLPCPFRCGFWVVYL
jgi:hypothetical protein